ncbi:MAG: flavodoxin family protein [Methanoregula sp.]|jgi:flavodoxin I|uniref:flavodoxin family protein n=1 Tax=Methanoregula sp. TaxID=2052170 RepID=UPI003D13697A
MDGIAVLVDSQGGNTKKIARAIAEELGVVPGDIAAPVPEDAQLLFLGSGTYSGHTPGDAIMRFIRNGTFAGRRVALFGTAGYENDGQRMIGIMADALEKKGATIIGVNGGRGRLFVIKLGRPHQEDFDGAKAFAREVVGSG